MPRPTVSLSAAALCAGLLLAGTAARLHAQEAAQPAGEPEGRRADPGPFTTISSFRGIEFGASADDIRAVFGEPIEERRLANGLRMFAYRGELAGQASVILFGLLDDRGFVKAQEVVDLPHGERCISLIREIHHQIDLEYPLIRPAEQAQNNSPEPICEAAPAGQAYWHRQWRDEATGAVVTVSVPSGSDEVDLVYESKVFRDWVAPDSDAATGVIDDEGAPEGELREP